MGSKQFALAMGAFIGFAVVGREAQAARTLLRPAPASGTTSGTGLAPATTPAATPYKDTGKKPGTGRSGTASLSVRALVDKANQTELEITTGGAFDTNARAPGNLEKVQVKGFNASNEVVFTKNFNKAVGAGMTKLPFDDLRRGQDVQVQANVSGIDGNRNDVVTVKEQVKLRPDIKAAQLQVPKQAYIQAPVNVSATILEINRDVGARGDCVLYVDGAAVDRATGIWVDAAGSVSCAFSYIFAAVGTKKVEVAIENVVPRDWDTTNQRIAGTIEIVEPSKPLTYWAYFHDYDFDYTWRSEGWYKRSDGTYPATPDYKTADTQKGWTQSASVYGWHTDAWTFPLKQVKASTSIDGRQVDAFAMSDVAADWTYTHDAGTWHYNYSCAHRYSAEWGAGLYICAYRHKDDASKVEYTRSSAHYWRYAGDVTYYSAGYNSNWSIYSGNDTRYSWNYSGRNARGSREAIGSVVSLSVEVTSGNGTAYKANPSLEVRALDWASSQPWTCSEYGGSYSQKYCSEHKYRYVGKEGSASR